MGDEEAVVISRRYETERAKHAQYRGKLWFGPLTAFERGGAQRKRGGAPRKATDQQRPQKRIRGKSVFEPPHAQETFAFLRALREQDV
jgi:hypothetical protein